MPAAWISPAARYVPASGSSNVGEKLTPWKTRPRLRVSASATSTTKATPPASPRTALYQ